MRTLVCHSVFQFLAIQVPLLKIIRIKKPLTLDFIFKHWRKCKQPSKDRTDSFNRADSHGGEFLQA